MFKYLERLSLSSLKRILRLSKKGYNVCVDFYACVKSDPKRELKFQVSQGQLFVTRDYFDPEAEEYGFVSYEDVHGITLDDIVVDSMIEIYYNSSKR